MHSVTRYTRISEPSRQSPTEFQTPFVGASPPHFRPMDSQSRDFARQYTTSRLVRSSESRIMNAPVLSALAWVPFYHPKTVEVSFRNLRRILNAAWTSLSPTNPHTVRVYTSKNLLRSNILVDCTTTATRFCRVLLGYNVLPIPYPCAFYTL
jgi:hypothetical protein